MSAGNGRGRRRPPARKIETSFSEILLHDLRVESARSVLIELAPGGVGRVPNLRKAVLHLVLDGTASFYRSDGQVASLRAGDCLLAFYGDAHAIGGTANRFAVEIPLKDDVLPHESPPAIRLGEGERRALILTSALDLVYLPPAAFASRALPDFLEMRTGSPSGPTTALLMDRQQIEATVAGFGGTAFATLLASLHLVHVLRGNYARLWKEREVDVRSPNTRRIAAAVQAMRTHPDRPWTLALIAQEVGLSRTAFAEAFRIYTGVTPLAYLTDLRMKRAAQLLQIHSVPLREVATRVGYRLEGSFARAFRRHFGVTPSDYSIRPTPPANEVSPGG